MGEADRRRYALVGTGSRGTEMYLQPALTRYADVAEIVGIHDVNPIRAATVAAHLGGLDVFDSFDAMLERARPQTVIVTSKDSTHDRFIVGALLAGCDVITEKPMTIDDVRCREILDVQRATRRDVRVAFNYRYAPIFTEVKRLLVAEAIGEVRSVDFHWYLDTDHGADYFRRWHRRMVDSGGLFVHKACHHFDLVNWWLDDRPADVSAAGDLRFYGPTRSNEGSGAPAASSPPAASSTGTSRGSRTWRVSTSMPRRPTAISAMDACSIPRSTSSTPWPPSCGTSAGQR